MKRIAFLVALLGIPSRLIYADTSTGADKFSAPPTDSSNLPISVAGVRGLEDTGDPVSTQIRDYPAIDKLDTPEPFSPDDLKKFIQDGGLK